MGKKRYEPSKIVYYVWLFIFYIIILLYHIFIYWPLFILFLIYWFFRFYFYLIIDSDEEIIPYKFPLKGDLFVRYAILKVLMKPYLNSFVIYYAILKLKVKKQDRIQIRVDLVTKIVKNICIRLITGISVKWYKDARYCSKKLILSYEMNYNSATEDKSYFHAWVAFIFNAYMDGLPETNKIERRKIFKSEKTVWNFNPDREKKITLFKKICTNIDLVFPESTTEKKIANLVSEYSNHSKDEYRKLYFSINNSDPHYGILYKTLNNEKNIYFCTNFTKAETTFSSTNIRLTENSLLVKPYSFTESWIKTYPNQKIANLNDDRRISDEFNIQELLVLSSIWFEDFKTLTVNTEGRLNLKNTGRPRFIKDSVMEEFERELMKIKISLNPKLFINHETLFKQSIAAMLENPETFELLEYWANNKH